MVRSSHIISACFGALFCAAILQPGSTPQTDPAHAMPVIAAAAQQDATAPPASSSSTRDYARMSVHKDEQRPTMIPGQRRDPTFTAQMARNCIEVARLIDPDMAERLEQLQQQDHLKFQMLIASHGRRLLSLAELRERDPKLFSLKMQEMRTDARVMQVARDLRRAVERADETTIIALERELEVLLNMQFAFTIAARAEYLMQLESHVEQLRKEIDEMVSMHASLISERLEELKCGDAPVQPSWQRYSSSYEYAARIDPALVINPISLGGSKIVDDDADNNPDE